jgi:HlyD family secretion protein
MDIARPSNARQKRIKQALYIGGGLLAVALVSVGLSRLRPAAPTVEAGTVWKDQVKRGPMLRQVRGLGTLVPEDIRWITSTTQAKVEKIILRPGVKVTPDSEILELSNPQLDQELENARLQLQSAEASLANLRVVVQNDLLNQRSTAAQVEAEFNKAKMKLQMDEALAKDQLVSELQLRQSQLDAQQLGVRNQIAQEQLASRSEQGKSQLAVQQSAVDQARAVLQLKQRQRDDLKVRAGINGILQQVEVSEGQQMGPGVNLARVADPSRLKAEIKVAETQARDIQIGQRAEVDTRVGFVPGRVTRIDPSVQNGTRTVDVSLEGELPRGAVPDLSVDGNIELERLNDVLFMGRPAFGQEAATITLFKIEQNGVDANRVQVKLGKQSVNQMEIVSGLNVGDWVILSDMSAWDAFDRVRLR